MNKESWKSRNHAIPRGENCFHSESWWRKVKHRPVQLSCGWRSVKIADGEQESAYVRKKLLMIRKTLYIHNLREGYTDFLTVSNFLLKVSNFYWRSAIFTDGQQFFTERSAIIFWLGGNLACSFGSSNSATYLATHSIGKMTVAFVTTVTTLTAEMCLARRPDLQGSTSVNCVV